MLDRAFVHKIEYGCDSKNCRERVSANSAMSREESRFLPPEFRFAQAERYIGQLQQTGIAWSHGMRAPCYYVLLTAEAGLFRNPQVFFIDKTGMT